MKGSTLLKRLKRTRRWWDKHSDVKSEDPDCALLEIYESDGSTDKQLCMVVGINSDDQAVHLMRYKAPCAREFSEPPPMTLTWLRECIKRQPRLSEWEFYYTTGIGKRAFPKNVGC